MAHPKRHSIGMNLGELGYLHLSTNEKKKKGVLLQYCLASLFNILLTGDKWRLVFGKAQYEHFVHVLCVLANIVYKSVSVDCSFVSFCYLV